MASSEQSSKKPDSGINGYVQGDQLPLVFSKELVISARKVTNGRRRKTPKNPI